MEAGFPYEGQSHQQQNIQPKEVPQRKNHMFCIAIFFSLTGDKTHRRKLLGTKWLQGHAWRS